MTFVYFSRRAQAHAKRAHPHANSTTSGHRGHKTNTLRVSLYQ